MEARVIGSLQHGLCIALPLSLIFAGVAYAQPLAPGALPIDAANAAPATVTPANPATATAGLPLAPANALPVVDPAAEPVKKVPVKPPEPLTRVRSNVAILQALDKVTAETIRFEASIGQPVRYKTLVFTVRACETAADEPIADFSAYMMIDSQPAPSLGRAIPPARQVFRGWMYAGSPGLNPLQHPVYDAWLIACRTSAPVTAVAKR